nr:hypothetical protein [Tanacetum cinerariifolium]
SHYKVVQAGGKAGETWIQILLFKDRELELLQRPVQLLQNDIGFTEFTIYEMMKGSFVWSVRYLINIVQLLNPLPEGWSIRTGVWSNCLGKGEEGAFMVIKLFKKVVKYNQISNTNTEIFDIGSNQMDDDDDAVLFIPPFEVDPNLYEFISSLASV